LIQTFFSTFSNQRDDVYGAQTLENRPRFGIEVIKAGQKVIDDEAPADIILGYHGTPEERRGREIGYRVADILYFIYHAIDVAHIHYLATASWGKNIYKQTIRQGQFKGKFMNQVVYDHIDGRMPVIANGGINTPDKALEALQFADMVGASTPFVTEPDFVTKLKAGRENEIDLSFSKDHMADLSIPERAFKDMVELMDIGGSLSDDTRKEISKLRK